MLIIVLQRGVDLSRKLGDRGDRALTQLTTDQGTVIIRRLSNGSVKGQRHAIRDGNSSIECTVDGLTWSSLNGDNDLWGHGLRVAVEETGQWSHSNSETLKRNL